MRGRTGLSRASRTPGERCARRTRLYKAGLGGWVTSVCLGSDRVTSLLPPDVYGAAYDRFAVSTAVRRAGSIPGGGGGGRGIEEAPNPSELVQWSLPN